MNESWLMGVRSELSRDLSAGGRNSPALTFFLSPHLQFPQMPREG